VRVGVVILPEARWSEAEGWWREAEALGFDHAWTYDHLGWRSLVDRPWFDAMTTLTAAATVTRTLPLGTLVSSANTRRPPSFVREIITVDDVSDGRFRLGLGSGGTGNYDNVVFGGEPVSARDRAEQFGEFVECLDRLLVEPRADFRGGHVSAVDARSHPGCVQQPRVPFVIGALGPRAMRLAVDYGQAWVTTGRGAESEDEFWAGVAGLARRFTEVATEAGRDPDDLDRMLLLDAAAPTFSLTSPSTFEDHVGRAADLGFTDVVVHRPRPDGVYAGDLAVYEQVATHILPTLREKVPSPVNNPGPA
jgi:alkanesulfonate monooxygenase SsuD/methylene tetrahydromethanopterin reductase-like flavin-dependent oxidoreductase (luciferase family)